MSSIQATSAEKVADTELIRQLETDLLPRHVAIIMDGNGRWAAQRGLPRIAGHRQGLTALQEVLEMCQEIGVPNLTIYAFSHENWNRPTSEINMLMVLLEEYLQRERRIFLEKKSDFYHWSARKAPSIGYECLYRRYPKKPKEFTHQTLAVALSYGGRSEIIDAVRKLVKDIQLGNIHSHQIDENLFEQYLTTCGLPDP